MMLRFRGLAVTLVVLFLVLCGGVVDLKGQSPTTLPPERVIHLWVDPMYGNDSFASGSGTDWGNPAASTTYCTAVGGPTAPNLAVDSSGAVLLHASWPFKTVTAAVNYIFTVTGTTPPAAPLPYYPSGASVMWSYAVIHCLPGMYRSSTGRHPDNGLPCNGETFPIVLPRNVSIQGTSALNTVFDLDFGNQYGPAFEFGTVGSYDGQGTFISGVSICGVGIQPQEGNPKKYDAAIYLGSDKSCSPTISNCFLFRNFVGVLVAAGSGSTTEPTVVHHGTKLFNNTLAFNRIGLWNGQDILPTEQAYGWSKLILVNNIFDGGEPDWGATGQCRPFPTAMGGGTTKYWRSGASGFEGVCSADLTIAGVGGGDYNAYEESPWIDYGTAILANLPPVTVRSGTSVPIPSYNISLVTGRDAGGLHAYRGVLYIRDLFCNMQAYGNPALGINLASTHSASFDCSPMDFRLSPDAAPWGRYSGTNFCYEPGDASVGSGYNSLIDSGWSFSGVSTSATMASGNGLPINWRPGYLVMGTTDSQNKWAFTNWDFDCEGFGNPRIYDHPRNPGSGATAIDIGADEVGDFIVAGYRFGTTMFVSTAARSFPDPYHPEMDNKYLWYIGTSYGGPGAGATDHAALPDMRGYRWLTNPPTMAKTNYGIDQTTGTHYASPWTSWSWSGNPSAPPNYSVTIADIGPHLAPDIHPWWPHFLGSWMTNSDPVWQACAASVYNFGLYLDPTQSITNPSGTYLGGGAYQWLDVTIDFTSTELRVATKPATGFRSGILKFDSWCRGLLLTPPILPTYDTFPATHTWSASSPDDALAIRFSLEHGVDTFFSTGARVKNIQSYIVSVEYSDG